MKLGRPTKYRPEYCEKLIEHMGKGNSFESFGPSISTNRDTLYRWLQFHKAFSDAQKTGLDQGLKFWEEVGKAGTTGQLKRVSKERIVRHPDGREEVFKEYEPATFSAAGWIFTMKNRFRWRDRVETIEEGEQPERSYASLSEAELDRRTKEIIARLSSTRESKAKK